jgi:hypothetical protein
MCPGGSISTLCAAGYYCFVGAKEVSLIPTAFDDEVFIDIDNLENQKTVDVCPVGHFCPEGSSLPLKCPAGNYCAGPGKIMHFFQLLEKLQKSILFL